MLSARPTEFSLTVEAQIVKREEREMFTRVLRIIGSCALVVGIGYAALGVATKPVQAASCTCDGADELAAISYCQELFGPTTFIQDYECPYGADSFIFKCDSGGE